MSPVPRPVESDDYIVKPFELGDLVDKIEQVLQQRSANVK